MKCYGILYKIIVLIGLSVLACYYIGFKGYFFQKPAVVIQQLSEDQEAFYRDSDKCLPGPGLENCLSNEEFFSETYFAYGDENVDSVLNNDYSNDPIE